MNGAMAAKHFALSNTELRKRTTQERFRSATTQTTRGSRFVAAKEPHRRTKPCTYLGSLWWVMRLRQRQRLHLHLLLHPHRDRPVLISDSCASRTKPAMPSC